MQHNLLQQLGFNEKEALIIEKLNQLGPSPASTLARLCNIKRTSIYDIINSLLKQTLLSKFQKGNTTYYAIEDLNKLYYLQQDKLLIAKTAIETLQKDQNKHSGLHINYYIGRQGFKAIYESILKDSPKELFAWLHLEEFLKFIDPVYEENWTKIRIKKRIHAKILFQDSPLTRKTVNHNTELYREVRLIKPEFIFQSSCVTYDDKIILFDSSGEGVGIKITHQPFATMQQQIFQFSWQSSKP